MVEELSGPNGRVAGLKQVLRCARMGTLQKVYVARDADENVASRVKTLCARLHIPVDTSYTMYQIGSACGLEVGSACAGVLKR
jgi:large subunit ribosomal protein L7A